VRRGEVERLRGRKNHVGGALKQEQKQILPQPLVWQRRQSPPQQVTIGPAPMKGVERTNAVVVRGSGQGMRALRRDPYTMKIDRGRNCYVCGGFGHMACHCRNWGRGRVEQGRRLEYREGRFKGNYEYLDNLKGVENLESLN